MTATRAQIYRRMLPTYSIRRWGPFCYAVYVTSHYLFDGSWGRDLPMFAGTRRTRRGARLLAEAELRALALAAGAERGAEGDPSKDLQTAAEEK